MEKNGSNENQAADVGTGEEVEAAKWGTREMEKNGSNENQAADVGTGEEVEAAKWGTREMEKNGSNENQAADVGTGEEVEAAKWGTREMGPPAAPLAHPGNHQAARWSPRRGDEEHSPYVLGPTPVKNQGGVGGGGSPVESIIDAFNSWAKKAETLASNVWTNMKTAPSMTDAAWGKLSLTAKAITEGGFESLYRQTFPNDVTGERLRKTFACYLSTAAGPVAGTLYLSTAKIAFCSDLPLSFPAPSGQQAWSYYKLAVPLAAVAAVSPVAMKEGERFVQLGTVDGHEFWFMGFVSYDKAVAHLREAAADFARERPHTVPIST